MTMTLWTSRKDLGREVVVRNAREILSERLWLPIYEAGGVDAVIKERLLPSDPPPPPPSWLPNPGSSVK